MIVPCIDLMDGQAVQLVQGREKALGMDVSEALGMFHGFPLLHVIDLDAALGQGDNDTLVAGLLAKCSARVGGGVKTIERAQKLVELGTKAVIVGSKAFKGDGIDEEFLGALAVAIGAEKVMIAIDTKGGKVAVKGWQATISRTPASVVEQLSPFCGGFLCTYVDKEGMLQGTDLDLFLSLRAKTEKTLVAAGGITTLEEVDTLTNAGIEVALGMAIYTGRLDLAKLREMNVRND